MDDGCNDNNKRVRDESPDSLDSPESKTRRVDSGSGVNSFESELTRVDSVESCPDSVHDSDVQLQDDILNMLDDADNVPDQRDSVLGLDSVIKSFEDEILASGLDPGLLDISGPPGELPENLGYLLEASDDELGLPPTVNPNDEPGRVTPEGVDLTGFVGFEDDITLPSFDEFGFGAGWPVEGDGTDTGAGGFVAVDGLFDYAEPAGDVLWRSESLQAM